MKDSKIKNITTLPFMITFHNVALKIKNGRTTRVVKPIQKLKM